MKEHDYLIQSLSLMPQGLVWQIEEDSPIYRLLRSLASMFAEQDRRICELEKEIQTTRRIMTSFKDIDGNRIPYFGRMNITPRLLRDTLEHYGYRLRERALDDGMIMFVFEDQETLNRCSDDALKLAMALIPSHVNILIEDSVLSSEVSGAV